MVTRKLISYCGEHDVTSFGDDSVCLPLAERFETREIFVSIASCLD